MEKELIAADANMELDEMKNGDIRTTVRSVERIAVLLNLLSEQSAKPKGISELSRESGMAKGTIHRLLLTMMGTGFVAMDGEKYCLGLKLVELGVAAMARLRVDDVAEDELERLSEETSLTVHLARIMEHQLLYIGKANSNQSIQTLSYIGQRSYLHSTGLGKAICAYLPERVVLEHLRTMGMPKRTEATIVHESDYLLALAEVRRKGYAVDNEENEKGIKCVAAPIFGNMGGIVAAISATTIVSRMNQEDETVVAAKVLRAAKRISLDMGCSMQKLSQLYPDT